MRALHDVVQSGKVRCKRHNQASAPVSLNHATTRHRRLVHVGMAIHGIQHGRTTARLDRVHLDAKLLRGELPKRGAGDVALLQEARCGSDPLESVGREFMILMKHATER
jgi:hypothetical protein